MTKFLLIFQPVFPLPLGHSRAGHALIIKAESDMPDASPFLVHAAREEYKKRYPEDSLVLDQSDPRNVLGGVISYTDEADLLKKAAEQKLGDYMRDVLERAITVNLVDPRSQQILNAAALPPEIAHAMTQPRSPRELVRGRR